MSRLLLVITALAELAAALALLCVPGLVFELLLATSRASAEALLVGKIAGAALLALGIACWLARDDSGSSSLRGVLCGMLAYNLGVAAVLGYAGSLLRMNGVLLWPAVAMHSGLAVWCAICLRPTASPRAP
ncbi:MAG TPA: hypothetical protein VGC79_22440 [Polyangiaceae bacterium]